MRKLTILFYMSLHSLITTSAMERVVDVQSMKPGLENKRSSVPNNVNERAVIDSEKTTSKPVRKYDATKPSLLERGLNLVAGPAKKVDPVTPKIEIEKIKIAQDVEFQNFNYTRDLLAQMRQAATKSQKLQVNATLARSYDATFPDTQAINARIKNFETATRTVAKRILNDLRTIDSRNQTGSLQLTLLGSPKKELKFGTLDLADKYTPEQKVTIAKKLVQSQLDTIFGTDSMTSESSISCSDALQKQFVETILKDEELFNPNLPDDERLQAIAKHSDAIMNDLCLGEPNATFATTIDKKGNYKTRITSKQNNQTIYTQTIVDNNGKLIEKKLIVKQANNFSGYQVTIDQKTGKSESYFSRPYKNQDNLTNAIIITTKSGKKYLKTPLSSTESDLLDAASAVHKAAILGRMMAKITLWSTKQIAFNVITHPIPQAITLGVIAPLALLVKGASMGVGYTYADPTIKAVFGIVIDATMGNRRAILSNSSDRVFTKGSTIAKGLNAINPWRDSDNTPDQNEEYYGFDADLGNSIVWMAKKIMPETFGDQLISTSSLTNTMGTSKINSLQRTTDVVFQLPSVAGTTIIPAALKLVQ